MVNENKEEVVCLVDTMQLSIDIENLKDLSKVTKENFKYITYLGDKISKYGSFRVLKFNPNKKIDKYFRIRGVKALNEVREGALEELGVINKEDFKMDRIDIAIDSDLDFKKDFKFILFLFEVATYGDENTEKWFTTNLKTLKYNSIIQKSRSADVCFYNKEEESLGRHQFKSRMEWRFKRISEKNLNKHLDKLNEKIKELDKFIKPLEEDISKRLINLWEEEKEELQSFSEFVRRYKIYFYTINVLKMVYKESGLKGGYKGWLDNFRRANNGLIFYTKSDLEKFKKKMIKAIKTYKKS